MNPNDVGHPLPSDTPPTRLFINRNVTGFATRKNNNAEYNENFALRPTDNAIYIVATKKEYVGCIRQ
jgi:hypothetical protein